MSYRNLIYTARIKAIKRCGMPVLIWNMGKVASTSIAHSLQTRIGKASVLTTHFMNRTDRPRSVALYKEFINENKFPIPIITLTREPISRNISSFFQNFELNTGRRYEPDTFSKNELLDLFLNRFDKHDVTLEWYDDNLKRFLGFDVYENTFDKNQGFSIHNHCGFQILTLRSEEPDEHKITAIEKLLNITDFNLINTNVGGKKSYSADYYNLKKDLKLPESYLDRMLFSKYTKYFYSAKQIAEIKAKYL